MPWPGDRNVGGLQVTVDYVLGMRGGQPGGDLTHEPDDLVGSHDPARETFLQRLAVIERHGNEQLVPPLADLVDRGDVRMVERAGGSGFSTEAQLRHRVTCRASHQELQCNITVERLVSCAIDDAHGAGAYPLHDAIVRDVLTGEFVGIQVMGHRGT